MIFVVQCKTRGIWNGGGFGTRPYRFTPQCTLSTNHPQIRYNQQNYHQPQKAVNWITSHIIPTLKDQQKSINEVFLKPKRFFKLLCMLEQDEINTNAGREVLVQMFAEDKNPEKIVEERGFRQVSDTAELDTIAERILKDNPSGIQDYKSGNMKVLGFFIGQAMKATQGKANPKVLKDLFTKKLN